MRVGSFAWGIAFLAVGTLMAADWEAVEKVLGRPGLRLGEALWVEFPRADLNILVGGVVLEPGLAPTCRFTFTPVGDGVRLEGEWAFLGREVPRALEEMDRRGLRVHSILAPLLSESPGIRLVGTLDEGDGTRLAREILKVLEAMGIPRDPPPTPTATPSGGAEASPPETWKALQAHLGPGILSGELLEIDRVQALKGPEGAAAPPLELKLRFQRAGSEEVACSGEILLPPEGVPGFLRELSKAGIQITALGPVAVPGKAPLASLRVWAVGSPEEFGRAFQKILGGKD